MLTDRDSLMRRLHELRSEHRDLDTVIVRLIEKLHLKEEMERLRSHAA